MVSQDARNMGNIWGFHKWWYPKMGCLSWKIAKKMDDKIWMIWEYQPF